MKLSAITFALLALTLSGHASQILSIARADVDTLKESVELPNVISNLQSVLAFYVLEENGNPNTYIYLLPNNITDYLKKYTQSPLLKDRELTVGDGGIWLAQRGSIGKPERMHLLKEAKKLPQGTPFFGRLYFDRLLTAIKTEADLSQQQDPLKMLPGLAELAMRDVDTIELSIRSLSKPVRLIGVVKAKENSPLADLFSQRLPRIQKNFLEHFATNNAAVFGYMLYNTSAVLKYRSSVYSKLPSDSDMVSKVAMQLPASQLLNSDGINVTVVDDQLNSFFATLGHWTQDETLSLLEAQSKIAQKTEGVFMQNKSAFMVGNTPVWSTHLNGESVGFTALSEGDIYTSSASVEDFSQWIRSTQQIPSSNNIYSAFNHYPTVCAQLMIKPQRLYNILTQRYPILKFAQSSITDENVYMAASIHGGQLGISVDLPNQAISMGIKNLTSRFLR